MTTVALILALAASTPSPAEPAGVERLRWLAGCWESVAVERGVEEQWMAPRGGTMLGMSRTVRGGRLVEYELVVLREEDGRLAYQAHPSGQPSAIFHAKGTGANEVVFENLEHDFPQRIGYRLEGDALTAWIEGTKNGQTRRVDFPYRRASCGGAR